MNLTPRIKAEARIGIGIGYGGGWYDNYGHSGYGFFLFDDIGRRYSMRDHYRRYWGEKWHDWYRSFAADPGQWHGRKRAGPESCHQRN